MTGDGAFPAAHGLLASLLLKGERAIVLDAANRFDPYALARAASRAGRSPLGILSSVFVSRAFTFQQWLALVEAKAAAAAARFRARWVFALGPLDLFADDGVKEWEAVPGVRRTAAALRTLARTGLGVVAAQDGRRLVTAGREQLLDRLRGSCGRVVMIEPPIPARLPVAGLTSLATPAIQMTLPFGPVGTVSRG